MVVGYLCGQLYFVVTLRIRDVCIEFVLQESVLCFVRNSVYGLGQENESVVCIQLVCHMINDMTLVADILSH